MKKLNRLKTSLLSRNWSLTKIASQVGTKLYFASQNELSEKLKEVLESKSHFLISELGEMKGSFLKAGQMLSLYAQDLVPPELANLFKELQSNTAYLEWIEIKKQIPAHIIEKLEIEHDAFAAASIGQVHKGVDENGKIYAVKIQYENIEKLIDTDLKILRWLLGVIKIVPGSIELDGIFKEIKLMLIQEMDYKKEAFYMSQFRSLVSSDYIIPKVYSDLSSNKVITSDYIDAVSVEVALRKLSIEQRTNLALSYYKLFLDEIFCFKLMQTDAHTGNYLIKDNQWVLLDFGATKALDEKTAKLYQGLIKALYDNDKDTVLEIISQEGTIDEEKSDMEFFWDYAKLLSEPLKDGAYDWASSDISKRIINKGRTIHQKIKIKNIPAENLFIDRKIAGVYYMLKTIGVPLNLNKFFYQYLKSRD